MSYPQNPYPAPQPGHPNPHNQSAPPYGYGEGAQPAGEPLKAALHDRLVNQVPELYDGRLPASLEHSLFQASNNRAVPYAIGFDNQQGLYSREDVVGYFKKHRGTSVSEDGRPFPSFTMYDRTLLNALGKNKPLGIAQAIEGGTTYQASRRGRLVTVFPDVSGRQADVGRVGDDIQYDVSRLPKDALLTWRKQDGAGQWVPYNAYNPKYTAFFIDSEGDVWVNRNFAQAQVPEFAEYNSSQRAVNHAGALALRQGPPQTSPETRFHNDQTSVLRNLEKALQKHRGQNPARDERLEGILQAVQAGDPNLIKDAMRLSDDVQEARQQLNIPPQISPVEAAEDIHRFFSARVLQIEQAAKREGRPLTREENARIVRSMIYADSHGYPPATDPRPYQHLGARLAAQAQQRPNRTS